MEVELDEEDWGVEEGAVCAGCGVWAGVAGVEEEEVFELCDEVWEELLEFPSAWLWF